MWYDDGWLIFLGNEAGKKTKKKLAELKNVTTFQTQYMRMIQDALERYEIEGVPETCDKRVILQSLLWYSNVVIFERDGALFSLPGAPGGAGFNIYGQPGDAWVFGRNGKLNEDVRLYIPGADVDAYLNDTSGVATGKRRGVIVWENSMRYPFINVVMYYAQQIADTLRTLEVSRRWLKRPVITFADESTVKTVRDYWNKIDDNEDVIIGTGIYDPSKVKVQEINVNGNNLTACTQLIEWYEAKYRELCGIDSNSQIDKKGENLISDEVEINNDFTDLSVEKLIPYLQEGFDNVNKIFGTSFKVTPREKEREGETGNDDIQRSDRG